MIGLFLPNDKRTTSKCVCVGRRRWGRGEMDRKADLDSVEGIGTLKEKITNDSTVSTVRVLASDSPGS